MIRYIYIGDQIIEGGTDFAFFNTVLDCFVEFGIAVYIFANRNEFVNAYYIDAELRDRCLKLIPEAQR